VPAVNTGPEQGTGGGTHSPQSTRQGWVPCRGVHQGRAGELWVPRRPTRKALAAQYISALLQVVCLLEPGERLHDG
jgi:hypothetical protein